MKLIIKGRGKFKVPADLYSYIEDKILKYEKMLPAQALIEVQAADLFGSKGGKDKAICITAILPGEKNPFEIEQVTDDFFGSVDLAQERLEKHLLKYKEKTKEGSRYPQKYWVAKKEEEEAGEI